MIGMDNRIEKSYYFNKMFFVICIWKKVLYSGEFTSIRWKYENIGSLQDTSYRTLFDQQHDDWCSTTFFPI